MALSQDTRLLGLNTPLGSDELLLTAFRGSEEMSRLFRYQLDMISDDGNIQASDIVGKNVTFSVKLADGALRFFNGFVSQFSAGDEDEQGRRNYRASVVPWLWFLTRTSDCRIFQDKSVPDIIEQIFSDLGFSDFSTDFSGNHATRGYCVQYRETDFNFVSRLCEEEGIFWFFKHEDGKHTLVLADHTGAYEDLPEGEVHYPRSASSISVQDHITSWEHRYSFRSGKIAQTDYNFETPSKSLMTNSSTLVDLPGTDKYEFYDYPGEYANTGDGGGLTDLRMEEEEVEHDVVQGTSLCKTFTPGGKFQIGKHRSGSEEGRTYLVTSIQHSAVEPLAYETGSPAGTDYRNRFTCIPDSVIYRPARITPKPIVQGPQTAVVVGPSGEEIYTDEHSRVKTQFFWDREGKQDEHSSCWIRVSQNWAGQNWGFICIPRIGQEVIVGFLEGDPDRPIIIGRVYNAEQMPPYELPANMTQSGIKSRSSKGGGPDNFNEIRFEDKLGSEEMYIHAEKDQNTVVENDQTLLVGFEKADKGDQTIGIHNDRSLTVGRDKHEKVGRNKTIQIGQNHTEQIGADMNITVGSSLTESIALNYVETVGIAMQLSVGAALSITVGAAMAETVGGAKTETIGGAKVENIGAGKSVSVGKDFAQTVQKNYTLEIGKDGLIQVAGKQRSEIEKDYSVQAEKIQLEAAKEINLKTGKAEIIMKKNGDITIKGGKINVKGSGNVTIKGSKIAEN